LVAGGGIEPPTLGLWPNLGKVESLEVADNQPGPRDRFCGPCCRLDYFISRPGLQDLRLPRLTRWCDWPVLLYGHSKPLYRSRLELLRSQAPTYAGIQPYAKVTAETLRLNRARVHSSLPLQADKESCRSLVYVHPTVLATLSYHRICSRVSQYQWEQEPRSCPG